MADRPPNVFISYSHDSPEHRDRVLSLANQLRNDGINAMIDRYVTWPDEGWLRWMRGQIEMADRVLVICTQTYRRRFEGTEELGKGRGANYEAAVISQSIYDADSQQNKYVPVLLGGAQYDDIPAELRRWTYFAADTADGYERLYRLITDQPEVVRPALGLRRMLPPLETRPPRWDEDAGSVNGEPEVSPAARPPTGATLRDAEWQREKEKRFGKLKARVAAKIRASKAALGELESAMGMAATAGAIPTDEERADRLVAALMQMDFRAGKAALLDAHGLLDARGRQDGVEAIRGVSRLLIPWLFVSGDPAGNCVDEVWWSGQAAGEVFVLPTSLKTFAEIVMAGLDRRAAEHRDDDLLWPESPWAVELRTPEGGMEDTTETDLRRDLFQKFRAPPEHEKSDQETQDGAIVAMLKFWSNEGYTPYLICSGTPRNEQEKAERRARLERIGNRYRWLSIVELGGLMGSHDIIIMNEIRRLLWTHRPDSK